MPPFFANVAVTAPRIVASPILSIPAIDPKFKELAANDPANTMLPEFFIRSLILRSVLMEPEALVSALPLTARLFRVPKTFPSKVILSPGANLPKDNFAEGAKPPTNFPSPSVEKSKSSTQKSKTVVFMSGSPVMRPSAFPLTPLPVSKNSTLSIPRSLTGPSTKAFATLNLTFIGFKAVEK